MVVGISFIYLNDLSNCNDLHVETIFKRGLKFTSENVLSTVEIVFIFWYNFNGKGCNSHCCSITVFSYLFHFFRLKELKNNNCMSGKSTLFQAKLLWPKWLSGETSAYHFHLSSPLKGFFYPTSLLRLCFLVLCTKKFQNCPCLPTPKPRQPLDIWIFWKIPQVCWQFVRSNAPPASP